MRTPLIFDGRNDLLYRRYAGFPASEYYSIGGRCQTCIRRDKDMNGAAAGKITDHAGPDFIGSHLCERLLRERLPGSRRR
jgi:hypothetical protein